MPRPKSDDPKVVVTLRLRASMLARYQAMGVDWRAKMEARLAEPELVPTALAEAICPDCARHVMADPQPATGWLAPCGRRLTRLEECGTAKNCRDPGDAPPKPKPAPKVEREDPAVRVAVPFGRPAYKAGDRLKKKP